MFDNVHNFFWMTKPVYCSGLNQWTKKLVGVGLGGYRKLVNISSGPLLSSWHSGKLTHALHMCSSPAHRPAPQSLSCNPGIWGAGLLLSRVLPMESVTCRGLSMKAGALSLGRCHGGGGGRGCLLLHGRAFSSASFLGRLVLAFITTARSAFFQIPTFRSFSSFCCCTMRTFLGAITGPRFLQPGSAPRAPPPLPPPPSCS